MHSFNALCSGGAFTQEARASLCERLTLCLAPINNLTEWWRHGKKTLSAILALCEGNLPVTGRFPSQWVSYAEALMFSSFSARTSFWTNSRYAGDLIPHDVRVTSQEWWLRGLIGGSTWEAPCNLNDPWFGLLSSAIVVHVPVLDDGDTREEHVILRRVDLFRFLFGVIALFVRLRPRMDQCPQHGDDEGDDGPHCRAVIIIHPATGDEGLVQFVSNGLLQYWRYFYAMT